MAEAATVIPSVLAELLSAAGVFAPGAAITGTGALQYTRMNSIAQFGNPWSTPHPGLPLLDLVHALPVPETVPSPQPAPSPGDRPKEDDEEKRPKLGRIYVTYTKFNEKSKQYYAGRTSAVVDLGKPLLRQARAAIAARDANHHIDENDEPDAPGFGRAVLDKFDVGNAVSYKDRYKDIAFLAIRGREQQLIDFRGGARSDTKPGPPRTENPIRGVARDSPNGRSFHEAANLRFGELHPYTGR